MNHIHYIARDIDFSQFQLLACRVSPSIAAGDGYLDMKSPLYHEVLNNEFVFYNSDNTTLGVIKLASPCVIDNYSHPNECIWRIQDGKLQFVGIGGQPTTIFDRLDNGNIFSGLVIGTSVTNNLRKLVPVKT